MQFPNIDDEDGDFGVNSTTRSRLSSLFQSEKASGDVNQALTFTAPKQPKKNDNSQSNQGAGTLKLIHASAVNAYKLIDGNYTTQGKLGCAILGWHEASNYQILLYKGKQVKVATCNIHSLFKFQVQQNNYASFYDDRNENWSINFDSETALVEFTKQIALAKANSLDKNQPSLIIQDLTVGEGSPLDTGDSAEVKYTGWLLTNFAFGQVFDTNMQSETAFRLRLGKKVIKGWSEGLLGAQKGTRRLLIVPPHLAYGAEGMGNAVPPNSTLIFEIIVAKVKVSRDSSHSPSPLKAAENLTEKKPEVLPRHSISSDDNIRQRGASISEQLTQSPKKDKAQLISRMAKMGTATLPFQGAIAAQVESGSESKEDVQDAKASPPVQLGGSRTSSPKPASRSASRKNSDHSLSAQPLQLHSVQEANLFHVNQQPSAAVPFYPHAVMPNQPTYNPTPGAFPAFQPQITSQYQLSQAQYSLHGMPSVVPTSIADTHLPMLITETRSQNTEMRLSLSKITEKIDTVIQKVDDVRYNQGRPGGLNHSSLLDSSMLLQSIEKIVQENSQLKEDVEVKNSKIQSLNEKIYDLLQRNQRFFEESNSMLEQKSDSLQAASVETHTKLLALEKEKAKLSSELSDALRKLGSAEIELANHQNHESELRQKLQEEKNHAEELDTKLSALREKLESDSENSSSTDLLQREITSLNEEKIVLSSQIKTWVEKYAMLNKDLLERTEEIERLKKQIDQDRGLKVSSNEEEIDALKQKVKEIQGEKDAVTSKYKNLETKLSATLKSESMLKEKVITLETELQNWKGKYEVFYRKTLQMKENYESLMKKLETELQQAQSSAASTESPDSSGEIKRMMTILYKLLQGKFEPSSSYSGTQVLDTSLQAIRTFTVQMLQRKGQRSDTIAKEADSSAPTNEVSSKNAINNESSAKEDSISKDDSSSEVVSVVKGVGVAGDASLTNELPSEPEAAGDAEEKSTINSQIDTSPSQLTENKIEHNDAVQNHVADSLNEESSKNGKEQTEKSKTISQDRASPDLSAANIPDTSNSISTKVLDGPSDMHA